MSIPSMWLCHIRRKACNLVAQCLHPRPAMDLTPPPTAVIQSPLSSPPVTNPISPTWPASRVSPATPAWPVLVSAPTHHTWQLHSNWVSAPSVTDTLPNNDILMFMLILCIKSCMATNTQNWATWATCVLMIWISEVTIAIHGLLPTAEAMSSPTLHSPSSSLPPHTSAPLLWQCQ